MRHCSRSLPPALDGGERRHRAAFAGEPLLSSLHAVALLHAVSLWLQKDAGAAAVPPEVVELLLPEAEPDRVAAYPASAVKSERML